MMKLLSLEATKEGENILHTSTISKEEERARGHCP
jgi:hypothetical protein